jgi:hypothetical protein
MNAKMKDKWGQVEQDTLLVPGAEVGLEKGNRKTLETDQLGRKKRTSAST